MNKWGLLGLVAAFAAFAFFTANKAKQAIIDGLNFISARITKPQFQLNQIVHEIQLTYRNTGPVALFFDNFNGALYYGNYLISYLSIPNRVSMPPNSDTTISIEGVIKYADFTGNILDLIKNKEYLNSLVVKGTVVVGGIKVPVTYPLQLI